MCPAEDTHVGASSVVLSICVWEAVWPGAADVAAYIHRRFSAEISSYVFTALCMFDLSAHALRMHKI